jgi:NitT/TauT family transport system ATP-binding protein
LLRVLLGLVPATSGTVWISPDRRSQGTAYIPQSSSLLTWRTVIQNAALGSEVKRHLDRAHLQFVKDKLKEYGLSDFQNTAWSALSGGMRQKVALLCALTSRPQLLFCDEPFSAIDFVTRLDMNTEFKKMCMIYGNTTIFVTHNIEEAIFLGDQVAVLSPRPGRIINIYDVSLSIDPHDAVKCRRSPEFDTLFFRIWQDLRGT